MQNNPHYDGGDFSSKQYMENKYLETPENIQFLNENEVFVFGTNESGFHGGGAAGMAFRYDNSCNWRYGNFFLEAMKNKNDINKITGKWAIFGKSQGIQYGKEGKSYGIITIKRPGIKRSRSLLNIKHDVQEFIEFALFYKDLKFYVTEIGCNLAGYSVDEIAPLFKKALNVPNIYLPKKFIRKLTLT